MNTSSSTTSDTSEPCKFPFNLSRDFFETKQLYQTGPLSRKGGPYPKIQRLKRLNEVCRLHYEYGYSARKIAEIMKVNRKTVQNDLDEMGRDMMKSWNDFDVGAIILKHYTRQQFQRRRLREKLDGIKNVSEQIQLEKLMMDLDFKSAMLMSKIYNSHDMLFERMIAYWNTYAERNGLSLEYITSRELTKVSRDTRQKIMKLIEDDDSELVGTTSKQTKIKVGNRWRQKI